MIDIEVHKKKILNVKSGLYVVFTRRKVKKVLQ